MNESTLVTTHGCWRLTFHVEHMVVIAIQPCMVSTHPVFRDCLILTGDHSWLLARDPSCEAHGSDRHPTLYGPHKHNLQKPFIFIGDHPALLAREPSCKIHVEDRHPTLFGQHALRSEAVPGARRKL